MLGGGAVPQSGPGGDLTAGAGRGGHRDHGQRPGDGGRFTLGQGSMDFCKITAGHAGQKHFGAVEHRSTAHGHHHAIGVLLPKPFVMAAHPTQLGVGLHIVDHTGQKGA